MIQGIGLLYLFMKDSIESIHLLCLIEMRVLDDADCTHRQGRVVTRAATLQSHCASALRGSRICFRDDKTSACVRCDILDGYMQGTGQLRFRGKTQMNDTAHREFRRENSKSLAHKSNARFRQWTLPCLDEP